MTARYIIIVNFVKIRSLTKKFDQRCIFCGFAPPTPTPLFNNYIYF